MAVLVTGSRGFIGSTLLQQLTAIGLDSCIWNSDIRLMPTCEKEIETVVHLAAHTRLHQFNKDRTEAYSVNVLGSLQALNFCKRNNAKFILASTSAVYKIPCDRMPVAEISAICPSNDYGYSKWLAEEVCRNQAEYLGVPITILRFFNVYGPGQGNQFLIPYLVDCMLQDQTIEIQTPNAIRDYVYIDDVIDALIKSIILPFGESDLLNIGSGLGISVLEIIRALECVFNKNATVKLSPDHDNQTTTLISDIRLAETMLGWSPRWTLSNGIVRVKEFQESGKSLE